MKFRDMAAVFSSPSFSPRMCVARTRGEPSSGSEGSSLAKARPEPSDGGGKVSAAASATQGDRDRHSLRCQVRM